MNTVVVIEDKATQQSYESEPYPMGTALDIWCRCGAHIHPIVGARCPKCGSKVVQIMEFR
jgi:ABC-type ATPase with predicted acetyltransferase domain